MFIREDLQKATSNLLMRYAGDIYVQYPELTNAVIQERFKAVDTGVHPKLLADWNRKGLLLGEHTKNKRHMFTLAEFVWIKLIEKMREYNFSSEFILEFRNSLVQDMKVDPADIMNSPVMVDAIVSMMPPELQQMVRLALAQPDTVKKMLAAIPFDMSKLTSLDAFVLFSLVIRKPLSMLLDHSGSGTLFSPVMFEEPSIRQDDFYSMLAKTHVSISITEAVAASLAIAPIDKVTEDLSFLSPAEVEVLSSLRKEGVASVKVRMDNNGEMDLLEVTSREKVDKSIRLMEMMLSGGYQDIVVKTQDGKVIHCENTVKVKLK
jgi:DNA-binding transcriptional MerR regulator